MLELGYPERRRHNISLGKRTGADGRPFMKRLDGCDVFISEAAPARQPFFIFFPAAGVVLHPKTQGHRHKPIFRFNGSVLHLPSLCDSVV